MCCVPQEPQREQLQALLDNIYGDFVATVAKGRSKSEAEVETMLNEGIYGGQSDALHAAMMCSALYHSVPAQLMELA
jgi:hypothetical protein